MKRKLTVVLCTLFILASENLLSQENDTVPPQSARLLSKYIQYPSVSGAEKEAGTYFLNLCKKAGLHINVFSNKEDSFNFSASLYPLKSRKPNIIFLNHIDVVPATDSSEVWTHPPFSGAIKDGVVWGRGAIDNKSMAIMQLMALKDFVGLSKKKDLDHNVSILSVSSEEVGGLLGAKLIADNHLEYLNPVVVLGEGGSGVSDILVSNPDQVVFGISIAQKNRLWLQLELNTASAGHGAVPPEEYSNQLMVKALNRLVRRKPRIVITEPAELMFQEIGEMEKGIRGFVLRHIRTFRPFLRFFLRKDHLVFKSLITNTVTITHVSNPLKSSNQIPQNVLVNLDCRLLPGTNVEQFIKRIRQNLRNDDITIINKSVVNERAELSPVESDFYKSLETSIASVYTGAKTIPILFPASNDNAFFRTKGVESYGLLPVLLTDELLNSIHNSNERMPVSELEKGIEVYTIFLKTVLQRFALSGDETQAELKD